MSKRLIIIGGGNVGGFIAYNVALFGDYEILGILDDDPSKQGLQLYGYKVLGSVDDIERYVNENDLSVVVAISDPTSRARVVEKFSAHKLQFPNFVSEGVWISRQVSMGQGIIVYPGTSINYETTLEDFVIINMNCAIGHNVAIGKFSTLAPGVNLAGFTKIEEQVSVGIGVATRQNIRIGSRAVIGGQSMLIKNVKEGATVAGVPGRNINR